jgi:tetratricopeptide (TPR) repeat protein
MYPWETLKVKKGDCDDLSVLYAACLQNIGINAALVLTPSHVFVMFDSGMSSSRTNRVILDPNLYRIEEGTAWIPVETTMLGKPGKTFFDAWLKGKEEYNPDLERVYINKAWQEFKPAWSGPEIEIELPDKNSVIKEYYNDIVKAQKYWQGIIDSEVEYLLTELESQSSNKAQIRNRLGINYAMKSEFVKAEEQFRQAILLDPSVTRYHNNLANVLLLQANEMTSPQDLIRRDEILQKVQEEYQKALESSPDSVSIRVNMAIYYFVQQKPDEAQKVIQESPNKDKLRVIARELGIPVTGSPRAGDLETLIEDKTQKAAQIQEKRKKLIDQIIKTMSIVNNEKSQELERQLSKLSMKELQKLSEGKSLPEDTKTTAGQMRVLIQEAIGSTEVSGTRAAGISEPEELQWWLSWMK